MPCRHPIESAAVILYEYPFNERIRTYLRLEDLFQRLAFLVSQDTPLDHHFAVQTLFDIMEVGARSELKSDILKDLERQRQQLEAYRGNPAIEERVLDAVLGKIERSAEQLLGQSGKTGQGLSEIDWLMGVRSRIAIPGGTCAFDLPAYHHWKHRTGTQRQADLHRWAATMGPMADAIALHLKMLRENGARQKVAVQQGQFQQTLPQGKTFQLMRLWLDPQSACVPEISANRLLMSVRLMAMGPDHRLQASQADAAFEMALCAS